MSKEPPSENADGPDIVGYYKQLFMLLLSESEDTFSPSKEEKFQIIHDNGEGETGGSQNEPVPFFTDSVGHGLLDNKKESLMVALREAVNSVNQEADEIESDRREDVSCSFSNSDENLNQEASSRKRKTHYSSDFSQGSNGFLSLNLAEKVRKSKDSSEICETVDINSAELLDKLCKMERGVDELLNEIVSHCRPMSIGEKQQLGKRIRKLPEKSFDRVVEILESRNPFSELHSKHISINLEKQDDVTLWRIYYYVETVLQASKV